MTKLAWSSAAVAILLVCALHAVPAQAQLARTFVSATTGNDANDCNRATPCRTFQGAHDKTNDVGEITVLDPGGYGAVVISKSISIVNDGVGEAGMLVSGGATGIKIDAPATAAINLRGITVQGIGFGGGEGLQFNGGFALTITNCVFRNHTGPGIRFGAKAASTSNLSIANTLIADNGNDGIFINSAGLGAIMRVAIDRTYIVNNGQDGLSINVVSFASASEGPSVVATVTDSVSANNGQDGFGAFSGGGATINLTVTRSVAANNGFFGFFAGVVPTVSMRFGQSVITGNAQGWAIERNAVLQSFGDNYIAGNADGDPAPPTIARK